MRKALGPLVVLAIFALAIPVAAHVTGNYKDEFVSIGWGGSDGSLSWSGSWTEIHDDNDEKFGSVRVVSSGNCQSGNCINITGAVLNGIGVQRTADVSVIESPELCYDLLVIPGLDLDGTLLVQAKAKGSWTTIAEHDLSEEDQKHVTLDLSDFESDQLRIRFLVTGLVTTSDVFIDNVEIAGELNEDTTTTTAPSTTTTTTTVGDGGQTTTSTTEGDGGQATTSTTRPNPSTTTTTERSTTTTKATTATTSSDPGSSTSTTLADTTTTSEDNGSAVIAIGGSDDEQPPGPGGPPDGSGIRQATRGLQADFDGSLFGQAAAISPITGVDFQARFSLAVEMIEASWVWIVLLALVISWSIVSGMERRRSQLQG